jgi:hypothetical protein
VKPLSVRFTVSGGWGGIRGCSPPLSELSAEAQDAALHLLQMPAAPPATHPPKARDAQQYLIEITSDEGVRELAFSDLDMPEEAVALVEELVNHSSPRKPA